MRPVSHSRRQLYFIIFAVLFIILIPVILLYATGYRVNSHFQLVSTGGIALTNVTPDMDVYLDYAPQKSSAFFNSTFLVKNLLPGSYFLVAAKDGYWSWAKHVTVSEKQVTSEPVLLIPQHPVLRLITPTVPVESLAGKINFFAASSSANATEQANEEYTDVAALFATPMIVPNASTTRINNGVSFWLAGTGHRNVTISWSGDIQDAPSFFCTGTTTDAVTSAPQESAGALAPVCQSTFVDYESDFDIKNADFFPGRNDVVILELADGLYALELDRTPPQNYEPVYLSNNIDFRVDAGKLYVKQNGSYYEVVLK